MSEEIEMGGPLQPTICRNCIFATWEEDGKTQEGCALGRIEKFEEQGIEVIGQDDGELRYLRINHFCNACRNHEWGARYAREDWKRLVDEKNQIKVDVVVWLQYGDSLDDLLDTIKSINTQEMKANYLLLLSEGEFPAFELVDLLEKEAKLSWRIEEVSKTKSAGEDQSEKLIRKYCKGTHYILIDAAFTLKPDLIFRLNHYINEEMGRFVVLTDYSHPLNHNFYVAQNTGLPILKLMEMGQNTETSHMIKDVHVIYEDGSEAT